MTTRFTALLLLIFCSCIVNAQEALDNNVQQRDSLNTGDLEQIIITAGRIPQKLQDVPQKTELIDTWDIEKTPALDITDMIKKNASVNVIQYPGLLSGVGIRGFRPQFSGLNQRTLLLIDGRPAGTTNLGLLDAMNIQRIEVLKGPASALYGSRAMGGVVNIITPRSSGPIAGQFNINYGSFDTFQANAKVGGDISSKLNFDLSGGYFRRNDNFKIGSENLFRNLLGADKLRNVYADGRIELVEETAGDGATRPNTRYSYHTTSARIGYKLSSDWQVDISGSQFTANDVESPGDIFSGEAGAGLKDVNRYSGDIAVSGIERNHELHFNAYLSTEKTDAFAIRDSNGNVIDPSYMSRKTNYDWQGVQLRDAFSFGSQKVILGYDYENAEQTIVNFSAPEGAQQNETTTTPNSALSGHGIYTQGQLRFLASRLLVNPGFRLDYRQFSILPTPSYTRTLITGKKSNIIASPSLASQYYIHPNLSVHGSVGRAYITPDAVNVAGYAIIGKGTGNISISRGNADLKNESSWSKDIGLRYDSPNNGLSADITYFSTLVTNRIATISNETDALEIIEGDTLRSETTYFNSDESKMNGLEVTASYDFGARSDYGYSLQAFANLTYYFDATDRAGQGDGTLVATPVPNIAKANLNYGLTYNSFKNISGRLSFRYTGRRWDTDFTNPLRPRVYYPEYMTIDLSVAYSLNKKHQLTLMGENLTDENYYEKRGYNLAARNYRVRYTFTFN